MLQHLNKLFIAVIVLAVLTYFERPDYNLPLFVFALALWGSENHNQKLRFWYLITFSTLIDFIWIVYWAAIWSGYENREKGLGNFTIFLSILELIVKFAIVAISFLKDETCKKAISQLAPNVKSIISGPAA